jgi:hypothetical protein
VPWFVQWFDGDKPSDYGHGRPDFRVVDNRKMFEALKYLRCWICGEQLGRYFNFVIGPMCALNRITSEPPSHRDCALFAVAACPFMVMPKMKRRENDLPEGILTPAGVHIPRNPGVMVVWPTFTYRRFRTQAESHGDVSIAAGHLIRIGKLAGPLEWFCEGRKATVEEIMHSIDSGLPQLLNACKLDDDPQASLRDVEEAYLGLKKLVEAAA